MSGLSSGEGLIYAVRDALTEVETDKAAEPKVKTIDPGVLSVIYMNR